MPDSPIKAFGIPYFLSSDGSTDQEFWHLANSLKQIARPMALRGQEIVR